MFPKANISNVDSVSANWTKIQDNKNIDFFAMEIK